MGEKIGENVSFLEYFTSLMNKHLIRQSRVRFLKGLKNCPIDDVNKSRLRRPMSSILTQPIQNLTEILVSIDLHFFKNPLVKSQPPKKKETAAKLKC